nr:hypothetical protein [Rhodococcus wratislaviensis]GLK39777.1 hypothetical protein GCM10017611_66480 [Rhodococcus wratislaviensis]
MNTTTTARTKILLVRLVVAGSIVTLPAGLAAGPAMAPIAAPAVASAASSTGPAGQDPCGPNNNWLLPPDQIRRQMNMCDNNGGQMQRDRNREQNSPSAPFRMSPPPGFGSS